MYRHFHDIRYFIKTADQLVKVEIKAAYGSTPREKNAWMLVGSEQIFRTIGGGQLENLAIEHAREVLDQNEFEPLKLEVPLGPHIGQCCGGAVELEITLLNAASLQTCVEQVEQELACLPEVWIFGAGHVGKALSRALSLLPVKPLLIDTREEELAGAPPDVKACLTSKPAQMVSQAKPASAFIVLTHDHGLDFMIAREALERGDAAYVGMIGSKTKRATFRNWFRRQTDSGVGFDRLVCPIGEEKIKDKRPEVIAALASAEIMSHIVHHKNEASTGPMAGRGKDAEG